jgi:hypothetical protein
VFRCDYPVLHAKRSGVDRRSDNALRHIQGTERLDSNISGSYAGCAQWQSRLSYQLLRLSLIFHFPHSFRGTWKYSNPLLWPPNSFQHFGYEFLQLDVRNVLKYDV